jgi:hypothetical protein
MGRPKGSKNLPKKQVNAEEHIDPQDAFQIPGGNQMLQLKNVDMENIHISLLAEVPGKGDWDFLLVPPFVKTIGLTTPNFYTPRPPSKEIFEKAYVSLGNDGKPSSLVIFVRILGGVGGWRKTSTTYFFPKGFWGDQDYDQSS